MLYIVNGHSKQRGNGGQHKGTDENTRGKPRSLEKTAWKMKEQKTRISSAQENAACTGQ